MSIIKFPLNTKYDILHILIVYFTTIFIMHISVPQNTMNNQQRKNTPGRRKKPCLSSRERNVRRIESNERERLRMHGLNIAFQVIILD